MNPVFGKHKICKLCKGKGYADKKHDRGGKPALKKGKIVCPMCGGKGYIEK